MSNRALQRKHGVGYRTVAAALDPAWPKAKKPSPMRGSRLDSYRDVIDGWLRDDLDAPRKQRHTAKRIFDRLLDETALTPLIALPAMGWLFLRTLREPTPPHQVTTDVTAAAKASA